MKSKRKSRRKTPAPPTKREEVSWSREWPAELFVRMKPPRHLVNPLIELGEDAPRTKAHNAYWDWVNTERYRVSCKLFAFLRERGWCGLTPDAPDADFQWPDDVPETQWRWSELALALAEVAFPALQDPRPRRPGPDSGLLDALDKVAAAHKASPHPIQDKEAYKNAGVTHTQFYKAKKLYVKVKGPDWWKAWERPPYK
jgi:hypothetical protein